MSLSELCHILIVDDDENARQLIKIHLKDLSLNLLEADNAVSALLLIAKHRVTAIISDIKMDGMDGIEFIAGVRANGFETPVIFLSGHADKDLAIKALKLGAIDFIEKEWQGKFLKLSVEKVLRSEELQLTPRLQTLSLTSTQIKILEMLMKGSSNKEIATMVNLSEHAVKYHVGNLFKRFDATNRLKLRRKVWEMVRTQAG